MHNWKSVLQYWRELSITTKFTVTFGLLLALIVLVGITSYVALIVVLRQTETAILNSTEIQRLVLEMDRGLENARRLQRDFFLRYPEIGYSEAYDTYAQQAVQQTAQVVSLSAELKERITQSDVSDALRERDVDLNLYLSSAERYADTFLETVELITTLAAEDTGLLAQLAQYSDSLYDSLEAANDPTLIVLYREMQAFEKDYLLTRQRPFLQSAFYVSLGLREAIKTSPAFEADQENREQVLTHLNDYLATAEAIAESDVAIRSKFHDFDLQAESIDPISAELLVLANAEVVRARTQIEQTSRFTTGILVITALTGLGLTLLIAQVLNQSVTCNVVKLTQVARELQQGNLDVSTQIDSADELGQLAETFNAMAAEIKAKVAELTELNQTLQASERRFRKLFEDSRDTIAIATPDGRLIDINEAGVHLTGYTRAELMERNVQILYANPQDRKRFRQMLEQNGIVDNFETQLRRQDGAVRNVLLNATVQRPDDGTGLSFQTIVHDITERKQAEEALRESEERFRSTFEQAAVGIAHVAPNGQFLRINQRFCDIVGYSQEEILTRTFQGITHPDDLDADLAYVQQVLANSIQRYSMEKRYICKDGSIVWVNLTVALVREPSGEPKYFIPVVEDITERRRLEEQLRQAQKMEAIGRLAGGVAHDFNNLLTAIMGYTGLVLETLSPNDPMRSDIEGIQKTAERASNLTRQLLAFARKQVIHPTVLNLNDLILNVDKMLRRLIGEDIELVTLPVPNLEQVKADPGQLEQVLLNLAVNARDAMPRGGKLTIETSNVTLDEDYASQHVEVTAGEYVLLAVSDTGIGMTEEVKAHLFEPFFTTKEEGKGTGLGLATCFGIVKQNGGHIEAYSEVNRGTSFKIYLPRLKEAISPVPGRAKSGDLPRGVETVLLVEDEAAVRELTSRILCKQGYKVLEAANGDEALRVVGEHAGEAIHLLFTDVVMPRLGGRELADRLKAMRPNLKILFTSGYTDNAIVHHGVLEPGIAFLPKPFSSKMLVHKVREVLDG